MRDLTGKTIIVTGATSGIGEKLSELLAQCSAELILVARSSKKLNHLKHRLEADYQIQCYVYTVELSNQTEWRTVLETLTQQHQIDAIINNAGFGLFEYAKNIQPEDMEKMFQVNVYTVVEATKCLIPHFTKQKHGHIINVASYAGKVATKKSSVYSATKHAVLGYTNAVRSELNNENIFVTAVNLGPVRTAFFETADPSGDYQKAVNRYMLDPEQVARHIIHALFKPKREVNLPRWMELGSRLYRLAPGIAERVMSRTLNKK